MSWTRLSLPKEVRWGGRVSEDASYVIRRSNRDIYVVVDGHGALSNNGKKALFATTAARWLAREIDKNPSWQSLREHFRVTSKRLDEQFDTANVGAVAAAVLVTEESVAVAWIGDVTVAYGGQGIDTEILTQEHTVLHPHERERLLPVFDEGEFGPVSSWTTHIGYDGPNRKLKHLRLGKLSRLGATAVCGQSLAVTRAFGDSRYRPALITKPDVIVRPRSSFHAGSLLCVYTDGAYKHLPWLLKRNGQRALTPDQLKEQYLVGAPRSDDTEILFVQL